MGGGWGDCGDCDVALFSFGGEAAFDAFLPFGAFSAFSPFGAFGGVCLNAEKNSENLFKSFKNFKRSSVFFKFPNNGFTLSEKSGFCESTYNKSNAMISILSLYAKFVVRVTEFSLAE
ncbi:MAG: hypothetical protein IJB97_00545 [Clostridia bacterium]|nr:hypothetical protein [Clostridia bacterium]